METYTLKSVMSVLVIEDNLGDVRILQEILKDSNKFKYNITYSLSLSEGIDSMTKNKFDILILDLNLPDSYELNTLKEIREYNSEIPIVVLTIQSNEELGISAITEGAQDFLIKESLQKFLLEKTLKFAIERKKLEQKIKSSQKLFEMTFEQASVGMAHLSINGKFLKINQKCCDITGYTKEELLGNSIEIISHKDDIYTDRDKLNSLLNHEIKSYSFEKRLIKKDGSVIWVKVTRTLIKSTEKQQLIFSIVEDIDLKKRTAQILNQSFDNYRLLAESSPDIIIRFDKNLNFTYVNSEIEKINSRKPEDLIGRNISEFSTPEEYNEWSNRFEEIKHSKKKRYFRDVLNTVEGEKNFETIFIPELDEDNNVNSFLIISRDITDRIESQKEIERKNKLLENILENIPVGVWIVDEKGHVVMHNKASEEIWGGTENISIRKQSDLKAWWADSGKRIKPEEWASLNAFNNGQTFINQIINIENFDGKKKTMMNSAFPIFEDNKVKSVVVVNEEVTRFIQIENELKASLAEKEMLMKEIHHRVKNNFQFIVSLLNLQNSAVNNPIVESVLTECQNRVKSMALLHERLYKSVQINRINLKGYINDLIKGLKNSYNFKKDNISIQMNIDEIYVSTDDAISIGLIINELVVNSFKHAFKDIKEKEIKIDLKEKDRNKLELTVKDNGTGIPENIDIEKIDSLGMMLINAFVKQMKGKIELIRKNGTEVQIISPRINAD